MKRTTFLKGVLLASLLSLAACSQQDASVKLKTAAPDLTQSLADVANTAKGFTVGSIMSANTVYVLFDPQCPHCGHLWQQTQPLLKKVKFVWVPVAFINAKSAPQGAALLRAPSPLEAMNAHEDSILVGSGGMAATSDIPTDIEAAIKTNTQLLNNMGVESVPFVIAKQMQTGQVVTNTGAMDTAALARLIGIDVP